MANQVGGTVVWNLDVDDKNLSAGLSAAKAKVEDVASGLNKTFSDMATNISKSFDNIAKNLDDVGNKFIKFGAAPTLALGLSVKAAIDFEDQMADVRKTVGFTSKEIQEVGNQFLELSRKTRTSIPDLVQIAVIGGQIGITKKDIGAFTEATNMAVVALGDEFGSAELTTKAIGSLATQYGLIKKLGVEESIKRVGSSLNQLGASGLATADYITDFANRLGGTANLLKITANDTLGLGAAIQESGLNVEASSSAIQRTLLKMTGNVDGFSTALGYTGEKADKFAKLMKTDVNEAFLMFLDSISKLSPTEALAVLDDLGLASTLTAQTLLTVRDKVSNIAEKQSIANKAFSEGTSLLNEYNVKNATTQAQLNIFINNIRSLGITIGNVLLPAINQILKAIVPVVDKFADFATKNPRIVTGILALGSAFTGVGLVLKGLSIIFGGFSGIFTVISASIPFLTALASTITTTVIPAIALLLTALGPIGLFFVSFIATMTIFTLAWNNNWFDIQGKTKVAADFIVKIFTGLRNSVTTIFTYLNDFIQSSWTSIAAFFRNIGTSIVEAILKPFVDAKNKIDTIASAIKESANKINPFYRNSPSLVDNVKAGIGMIKDQYSSLTNLSFPSIASSGMINFSDPIDATLSNNKTSPNVSTSNHDVVINNYINEIKDRGDIDRLNREMGFQLSTI